MQKMLKVIAFYLNCDSSKYQKQIIEPQMILWMLEIIEFKKDEKYLCCLTASILLNIVSKHEIHFYHQEVAIIKKFNINLQTTEISNTQESPSGGFQDVEVSDDSDSSLGNAELRIVRAQQAYLEHVDKDGDTDSLLNKRSPGLNQASAKYQQTLKMQQIDEEQDGSGQKILESQASSDIRITEEQLMYQPVTF